MEAKEDTATGMEEGEDMDADPEATLMDRALLKLQEQNSPGPARITTQDHAQAKTAS